MNMFFLRFFAFMTFGAIVLGCNTSDDPTVDENSKDRKEILIHVADNLVKPAYTKFVAEFSTMKSAANSLADAPSENLLIELRSAWVNAYTGWQKVELFEFGPADKYTLRNFFNIYPTDVIAIADHINNPSSNLDLPAAYASQGFPALDYLINGVASDNAGILSFYNDSQEGTKRIAFLKRLIDRMDGLLNNVVTEWDAYQTEFINRTGLDIGSSMGNMVNAYVLEYERYIRSGKFGIPSGSTVSTAGNTYPEKVEAYYKRNISLTLAKTAHHAAYDFFNGINGTTNMEGPSFKTYLDALDAKDISTGKLLSTLINVQFEVIDTKLNVLSEDFTNEITVNNDAMKAVYTEMQKLARMLKVDMTSAMSITITYTDNDGD